MKKQEINKTYARFGAKWYNPFKVIHNKLISPQSEKELETFLINNINRNKSILELGCGTGANLETIYGLNLRFKKYLGLDFTQEMLDIAKNKFKNKSNIEFMKKDITNLNIKKKFDIILCTWVLSHIKKPADTINNAQKLLNKNGKMFLIVFTKPRWYAYIIVPIAKYILKSDYLTIKEISKLKNVKRMQADPARVAMIVEIGKS